MPGKPKRPREKQLDICRIGQIINHLPAKDRSTANHIVQDLMDGKSNVSIADFCRALSKMVGHVPISTMSIHINGVCSCDPK